MNRPLCETCIHFDSGACLRDPPVAVPVPDRIVLDRGGDTVEWRHPYVGPGDACSHHQDFFLYELSRRQACRIGP